MVTWTGGGIALSPVGAWGGLSLGKSTMRAAGFALAPELGADVERVYDGRC